MNPTEDGAKDHQEKDVEVPGVSMRWNVEGRNVCGISGEGSRCSHCQVNDSVDKGQAECDKRRKEERNN